MRAVTFTSLAALAAALAAAGCGPSGGGSAASRSSFADVDAERLLNAATEPGQWLIYNGDYHETRYSGLDTINEDNVSELGLAWYADLPTNINIEGSPLFVDGVIYQPLPWSKVQAFDGATGELLWTYDPKVPGEWNVNVCCGMDMRGLAAWGGNIIQGTLDGRVVAIDAATGETAWEIIGTPREEPYSITGAPRVGDGKIFLGSAGGEFGVRGYIDAFDANNGQHLWRFWTVPGNPADGFEDAAQEMAAATWLTPGWWEIGGGGPVWDAITYDPENDLVMFGTGNGSPWSAEHRDPAGGDNLFLASIVAVHADTGEYAWHYQQVPWETWDYDAGQQLTIADLEIDGVMRHVVMQASKNGVFYVLDAATGEFLSATPYTAVNWASGWDPETGRPDIVPGARYDVENHAWNQAPGPAGGHAWQGMSYHPGTGFVYIPATETYGVFAQDPNYQKNPGGFNLGVAFGFGGAPPVNPEDGQGTVGRLIAWDPVARREVWRSADFPTQGGGIQMTGGIVSTAGNLVFQGNVGNREVAAYRATDGEKLWSFDAKTAVMASPITFEQDGEQYVAVAVGGPTQGGYYAPNGARLLVFKIGGTTALPDIPPYEQPPYVEIAQFASDEVVAHGAQVFATNCAMCHGQGGAARSTFPDLRRSGALTDQALFDAIVLEGVLAQNGMASFADRLEPADTEAARAYLVGQADAARNAPAFGFGGPPPPPAADDDEDDAEVAPAEGGETHEDPNAGADSPE
jgi:PQQ-dependent dehydrogenase (methanol/ethanol family)